MRIKPRASAEERLLFADALDGVRRRTEALVQLQLILDEEPEHRLANERMLRWADHEDRQSAARRLLRRGVGGPLQRAALEAFDGKGLVLSSADARGIRGWVASGVGAGKLVLRWASGGHTEIALALSPNHPAAWRWGGGTDFALAWPEGASEAKLAASDGIEVLTRSLARQRAFESTAPAAPRLEKRGTLVIVPVYDDFAATAECFEALRRAKAEGGDWEVLAIDDETPDPRIATLMDRLAARGEISLLRNAVNLGFVASVNRGLRQAAGRDVILLNADTLPPPGFVERLKAAAYAHPDIGTVTPFSNNGEYTSFPEPFTVNELPPLGEVLRIDALASETDPSRSVDLPNGIGFCMFITRRCLDAVGLLDETIERGYLEDVQFCLAARRAGLRNVCATNLFVGHHGTLSFGGDKRMLVVRNLKTVEQRFPLYGGESALFLEDDPLREARAALEERAMDREKDWLLLVAPAGANPRALERRTDELLAAGRTVLLLSVGRDAGRVRVKLRAGYRAMPQNLAMAATTSQERQAFRTFLFSLGGAAMEFFDPMLIPPSALADCLRTGRRYRINLSAVGAVWPSQRAKRFAAASQGVVLPSVRARKVLDLRMGGLPLEAPPEPRIVQTLRRTGPIGVFGIGRSAGALSQFLRFTERAREVRPEASWLVLEETGDDLALMRRPDIFVLGDVAMSELGAVLDRHGVGGLLSWSGEHAFCDPLGLSAELMGYPVLWRKAIGAGKSEADARLARRLAAW